jgi:hypothetical protein
MLPAGAPVSVIGELRSAACHRALAGRREVGQRCSRKEHGGRECQYPEAGSHEAILLALLLFGLLAGRSVTVRNEPAMHPNEQSRAPGMVDEKVGVRRTARNDAMASRQIGWTS